MSILNAVLVLLLLTPNVSANNKVNGDQTVGGIHFFEVHSTSGGMGIGIKIIIALFIAALVAYFCIRQKAKRFLKKSMMGNLLTNVTATQPMLPNVTAQQAQQPFQLVVQAPRRHHRHRDYASESETSYQPPRRHRNSSGQ